MTTTVTRLFNSHEEAKLALRSLENAGIPGRHIALVSNAAEHDPEVNGADGAMTSAGNGAGIGAVLGGILFMLAGFGLIAIPGLGPLVASGWFIAALAGAVSGAVIGAAIGGVAGAATAEGVPPENVDMHSSHLKRGGALLSVRVNEGAEAERVESILASHQNAGRAAYNTEEWRDVDPAIHGRSRERVSGRRH